MISLRFRPFLLMLAGAILVAAAPSEAREIRPALLFELGGFSEDENQFFGMVNDIALKGDEIFLLDSQLHEIKVFGRDGSFRRSMGRDGEGPGEFRNPLALFDTPRGELGVVQPFPSRLILLKPDGTPGSNLNWQPEDGGFVSFRKAARAEDAILVEYATGVPGDGSFVSVTGVVRLSADGEFLHDIASQRAEMAFANSLCVEREWNGLQGNWVALPGGIVATRPSFERYAVQLYDAKGQALATIEEEPELLIRSDAEIAEIQEEWAEGIARWVKSPSFEIEQHWPPVESLHQGPDGRLWVRTARGRHALESGQLGSFRIYDPTGDFVEEVKVYAEFNPERDELFLRGDLLIVVTDLLPARRSRFGGSDDDEGGELEPMTIRIYQVGAGAG